jgi:ATP-dependent Lhr-like helicase
MASDSNLIHLLTVPPSSDAAAESLPPELRAWFAASQAEPTVIQRYAWPAIEQGGHLLLCSPTGSGKTLAAFMPILGRILAQARPGLQCLYVAPLKALVRDVRRNLKRAWQSIQQAGHFPQTELRLGLRTGDTAQRVRQRQLADPPAILLTTPESLAQLLANPAGQELFRGLRWVVVDEIHALVGNKRGGDLALSLERLANLNAESERPQRIGLSATCAPVAAVAQFLAGTGRSCSVAQVQDAAPKEFLIEPLCEEYTPGWLTLLLDRLEGELAQQRTTLIFANTRRLAERLTWALRRRYETRSEEIAVHHSSLSATRRRVVERRLKQGLLWVVVSSASLELGIDIGTVDSVVFVHPPGGVARMLQRVGRSGHRPDQPRRGVLLTGSPGELLESAVTVGGGLDGQVEAVRPISQPFDVLCQHLVGMAMTGLWSAQAAYDLVRRASPYRDLSRADFEECLDYLSGRRRDGTAWLHSRLMWEGDCFTIASNRVARVLRPNLGTILTPDTCSIHLRLEPASDGELRTQVLGEVESIYADRLRPGDRFVLDGRCLELRERDPAALMVDEVFGRPQVPRWLGGGIPMPSELARRIYLFRVQAAEALRDGEEAFAAFLRRDFPLNDSATAMLKDYLLTQETVSEIPALPTLLIECVSMQACMEYAIHTPLPRSANEVLARVLAHRCRDRAAAPLLAVAGDLGIYLITAAGGPMTPDDWRGSLRAEQFEDDFDQHLLESDLVRDHFARLAQTGLMVLRHPFGQKRQSSARTGTAHRLYERIRYSDPDFILLRQAHREVRDGLCDLPTALEFVRGLRSMTIRLRHLPAPSPLGETLLRMAQPTAQ